MFIKLYSISHSPPTRAVRMALKYLELDYELVDINFRSGEQTSDDYKRKNLQGEVPLLDDDGFQLSESVAILQYLADKYRRDDTFYPTSPQERALVNHRLAFYLSTFYKAINDYVVLPAYYAYSRTDKNLTNLEYALKTLDEILKKQDTPYSAGKKLTIADLSLVMGCVCLEAIDFDFAPYARVREYYQNFKESQIRLFEEANECLDELLELERNPPDLRLVDHPLHPTDRSNLD